MSISQLGGNDPIHRGLPIRAQGLKRPESGPTDSVAHGDRPAPMARVDQLIRDIQKGTSATTSRITAKIRPQELTLDDFTCKKYIIKGDGSSTPWAPTYLIPSDNKTTGWRKLAQVTDEVLTEMKPQRPVGKLGLDPAARMQIAKALRKEVELALRKQA